ncbi:ABC transporter permease [Spirochaeta thermophila]|uniref:Permease domain protein n=1 Tax=Winmispira thermophila (strain ATCC 49972 / DSM 6192 / RI 19.B1) TaxID=665571 RepID=E0RPG8_WINT6|nr:ABC transporter permease [Spirochaeta thermophila]ADN02750.1 permease domain protein [Spirochaeta thermophila DSM 6192]
MQGRIIAGSFLRDPGKKVLAGVTMLFASALVSLLLNLTMDIGDKMARELSSYGANLLVTPRTRSTGLRIGSVAYNPFEDVAFLEESDLPKIKSIFWRHNITAFAPFLESTAALSNGASVPLVGTYFYRSIPVPGGRTFSTGVKTLYRFWEVEGRFPEDEAEMVEVLVGTSLARRLGVRPGEVLTLEDGGSLLVTGILASGGEEDEVILAPLSFVQRHAGLEGKVSYVRVAALTTPEDALARRARRDPGSLTDREWDLWYCTAYVGAIAYQLEEAIPNARVSPVWQVAAGQGEIMTKVQFFLGVITIVATIAAALGISSIMTTVVLERSREIGLMKALGAPRFLILSQFYVEAGVIGLLGGAMGWALGYGMSGVLSLQLFGRGVGFRPVAIPLVLLTSLFCSLFGTWFPSRMIERIRPAEVLHGSK